MPVQGILIARNEAFLKSMRAQPKRDDALGSEAEVAGCACAHTSAQSRGSSDHDTSAPAASGGAKLDDGQLLVATDVAHPQLEKATALRARTSARELHAMARLERSPLPRRTTVAHLCRRPPVESFVGAMLVVPELISLENLLHACERKTARRSSREIRA